MLGNCIVVDLRSSNLSDIHSELILVLFPTVIGLAVRIVQALWSQIHFLATFDARRGGGVTTYI